MNEPTPPIAVSPLNTGTRLFLEALQGTLAFVLAGIAAANPPEPYDVIIPLIVGAIIVFIGRLLGQTATDAVAQLTGSVNRLVASKAVLLTDAKPTVVKDAEAAAAAISVPKGAPAP